MSICDACGARSDMVNNYCRDCPVPLEKMSKKNKAALCKQKRNEWGFSPATRVKPSKKVYTRKKKEMSDREKVIKGLERCSKHDGSECLKCPYFNLEG